MSASLVVPSTGNVGRIDSPISIVLPGQFCPAYSSRNPRQDFALPHSDSDHKRSPARGVISEQHHVGLGDTSAMF